MINNIDEDIKLLKSMNDGYTFQYCRVCTIKHKYDEEKGVCKSKECDYLNAIENVLADRERLIKESRKLMLTMPELPQHNHKVTITALDIINRTNEEWKDKIIAKIEELRNDIEKNNYDGHILDEMYLKIQVLEELLGG